MEASFLVEAVVKVVVRKLFGQRFSPELQGASFGTEHEVLIGRLTDIYLAGKTGKLSDRALRYLHEEIQDDERSMPYCFDDLVHEFWQRSRAATQVRSLFPDPAAQVRSLNPGPRLGLVPRLMKEIIGGESANLLALINLGDVDSYLEKLNDNCANLLEHPEIPPSYATERHFLTIAESIDILGSQSLESEILGRNGDKEKIWEIIISSRPSDSNSALFVPISGMPGSGKTTLARLVYNDLRVKEHFDCRMWVAVPRKFDIELIKMKIIKCLTRSANHTLDLGSADELYDYLRGSKYFLVLDDVWSRNEEVWELVKSLLSFGKRGSAVIVTTTQSYGGPMTLIKSAVTYTLNPLPEDICVKLLVKNDVDLTAFSEIVKQIVRKCHGVPLAINMIGGMLRCQPKNVHGGLLQSLDSCTTGSLDLFTLIKFSYQTLPWQLQLCILYLTLFPSDYTFGRREIIDLWNAMGFISCTQQGDDIEKYGDLYIDILVSYYFLQEVQYLDGRGNLKYRITSQLYFALEYASEGMMFARCRNKDLFSLSERISHLSLLCDGNTTTFHGALFQENNLRTLLLFREGKMDELKQNIGIAWIDDYIFLFLRNLRVLDLHSCAISKLPNSIVLLSHLRYLNLSETNIKTIPKSMTTLRKLQVLNLSYCKELRTLNASITKLQSLENLNLEGCCKLDSLPEDMCYVRKLRHLNILECSLLTCMPRRMGQLSHLQTLSRYIVTADRECTVGELQNLVNLKGALRIENLEKVLDPEEAKKAELISKSNVTSLALHWSWLNFYNDKDSVGTAQQVLNVLQPPPLLKKLDIFSYPGTGAPQWMTNGKSTLESLVEIRLVNLKSLKSLPPLGQFPCLKVIEIRGMDKVTRVDDTFYGNDDTFPKLEKLTFSQMPNLQKWEMKDDQNKFPCLIDLTVAQCPKLKALHFSCSSLENLTLLFNNAMLYSTSEALKYFSTSLRKLTIGLCCELVATKTCKALHGLTALEELEISECDKLISLQQGMSRLTSLRCLTVTNCTNLETLPDWPTNSGPKPKFSASGCPKLPHQI